MPFRIRFDVNTLTPINPITKTKAGRGIPVRAGERSDASGKAIRNIILLSLPDEEYALLRPGLDPVDLPQYQILHEPAEKIDFAYFLNDGMASIVALNSDGRSVEVGIVGKEGMLGMPLMMGIQRGTFRAIMQMSGSGVRIPAKAFLEILPSAPTLKSLLGHFALMHGMQTAQLAACNRLHDIDQRLVRWLLMCQDRVDSQLLPLTHEFLAQMLGTGRPSVTLAAGVLEESGLIENLRGTVRVLNRKNLEAAACECYGVIQHFNGKMGLK
ncbi:MAG: Crp/Fnr family transcriptional regulator [Terriglobales bacterium]|jgi:CRP-like cAMP-binding protein